MVIRLHGKMSLVREKKRRRLGKKIDDLNLSKYLIFYVSTIKSFQRVDTCLILISDRCLLNAFFSFFKFVYESVESNLCNNRALTFTIELPHTLCKSSN